VWRDLPSLLLGNAPRHVVMQITDRCNASCPQCSMRCSAGFARSTMPVETALSVIEHASDAGVRALSFTGGEPMLDVNQLTRYIRFATARGIRYTRTGTNGYLFAGPDVGQVATRARRLADKLASAGLRNLWISLDSADPAVHEKMRGLPGVVLGIERVLPIFHEAGLYPTVNLGLTRLLGGPEPLSQRAGSDAFAAEARAGLRRFFTRALELGFTMANVCYPMSVEPQVDGLSAVYGATSEASLVRFTRAEKRALFGALRDVISEFRSQLRIFTPLSAVDGLAAEYARVLPRPAGHACRGGVDFVFVDTRGRTHPCGYRGREDLGPFVTLDFEKLERVPHCRLCDWECFRDPSELFGPVAGPGHVFSTVARSLQRRDRRLALWRSDLHYCWSAGLFDGRRAPNRARLAAFTPPDRTRRRQTPSPPTAAENRLRMVNPGEEMDSVMGEHAGA